jgi:peptidoglycan/LPS O-acetylase OafA/YrhL
VLTTAAIWLLPALPGVFGKPRLYDFLGNLTMLQTPMGIADIDPVYWTLWVELTFYLLFGVVVWRGLTYGRLVLFCGVWTVASLFALHLDNETVTMFVSPTYSPYFIAGIAFYLMYRFRPTPLLWGIVGISWLLCTSYALNTELGVLPWDSWHPRALAVFAVVTAIFVLVAVVALGWTSGIRWRWLSTAGAMTFPLYLIHHVIGLLVLHRFRDALPPWAMIVVIASGMIALAYLFQRFVERPFGRWVRKALASDSMSLKAPLEKPVGGTPTG